MTLFPNEIKNVLFDKKRRRKVLHRDFLRRTNTRAFLILIRLLRTEIPKIICYSSETRTVILISFVTKVMDRPTGEGRVLGLGLGLFGVVW